MNKKIRELAEQAQDWADAHAPFASEEHVYFAEKFAELIVRECISELEKIKRSGVPMPIQGGLNLGVVSLKEHFGVE
jgi:hypothetical protein